MKLDYKGAVISVIALAVIIRLTLLFIAPISMFADPVIRYLPNAEKILHWNFNFYDFPLLIILEAFWMLFLKGNLLWIAWKSTSLIFFIAILFLLPATFRRFKLNKKEQIIALSLFLFSTWTLLLSVTIMQEMIIAFFVLALFLSLEEYIEKPKGKWIFALISLTCLMILAKQTGYILTMGFGLYILGKKAEWKIKIKSLLFIATGALLTLFWPIKNYLTTGRAFIGVTLNPASLHSLKEYFASFILAYHYFWEIPLQTKVSFSGSLAFIYSIYYLGALILTAGLSLMIILALFKYSRKYKEHILLMLPLLAFTFIYWTFLLLLSGDAGRYTFPLWIFLFIFTAKFIESIKSIRARQICYGVVILFCAVSTISAFGIAGHMHQIDSQILDVNAVLKQQNATGTFITNDEFTSSALAYYLGQPVIFNLKRNVLDTNIQCQGESIFESENFRVFYEEGDYKICRS
ncbi:MAG: hypothetical protein V1886_02915 [archaeon]